MLSQSGVGKKGKWQSSAASLVTDDVEINGEGSGGGEGDADLQSGGAGAAECLAHGGRVRPRAARTPVAHQELRRGVRQERGAGQKDQRRGDAEHLHGRRQRHDPGPDGGRREIEHRARNRRGRRLGRAELHRQERRDRVTTTTTVRHQGGERKAERDARLPAIKDFTTIPIYYINLAGIKFGRH